MNYAGGDQNFDERTGQYNNQQTEPQNQFNGMQGLGMQGFGERLKPGQQFKRKFGGF